MELKNMFWTAICTKSGEINGQVFNVREVYPVVGQNNGVQVCYENKEGDTKVVWCHNFGDELIPVYDDDIQEFDVFDESLPHFM